MTGPVSRLPMWGLVEREIVDQTGRASILEPVDTDGPNSCRRQPTRSTGRGYVERTLRSGFPGTIVTANDRNRFPRLDSYPQEIVRHDVRLATTKRDPVRLAPSAIRCPSRAGPVGA